MSRTARRQILFVLVFLVVVALFVTQFQMGVVSGSSMELTYTSGQVVLVRRRHWFSGPLRHNDIILFHKGRDVLIKRIYCLAGEELPDDSFPYVKRFTVEAGLSDYYEQKDYTPPIPNRKRLFVQKGYLVMLGDNLRGSEDSRFFGPIPESDVIGVVVNGPPPPYSAAEHLPGNPASRSNPPNAPSVAP